MTTTWFDVYTSLKVSPEDRRRSRYSGKWRHISYTGKLRKQKAADRPTTQEFRRVNTLSGEDLMWKQKAARAISELRAVFIKEPYREILKREIALWHFARCNEAAQIAAMRAINAEHMARTDASKIIRWATGG